MERLTTRDNTGKAQPVLDGIGPLADQILRWSRNAADRLAAYEDAEDEERLVVFESAEKRKHIQELAEAERDGRYVVLPWKAKVMREPRPVWLEWDDSWFHGVQCPVCGQKRVWERGQPYPKMCKACGAELRGERETL